MDNLHYFIHSIIKYVVLSFMIINSISSKSQSIENTDSLFSNCNYEYKFGAKQLIAPTILITLGGAGITIHDKLGNWSNVHHTRVDDYIQYVPVSTNLFLGFCSIKHKHKFTDRLIISANAYLIEAAIVNGLKYTIKEKRPDSRTRNSWPSGHTATAFTGAELTRIEYGWRIGSLAYGLAITTGVLRVYNNRHWCNDILAGAGIGILSANIANWLYPVEKKWFTRKKSKIHKSNTTTTMLIPTFDSHNKKVGITLSFIL